MLDIQTAVAIYLYYLGTNQATWIAFNQILVFLSDYYVHLIQQLCYHSQGEYDKAQNAVLVHSQVFSLLLKLILAQDTYM